MAKFYNSSEIHSLNKRQIFFDANIPDHNGFRGLQFQYVRGCNDALS